MSAPHLLLAALVWTLTFGAARAADVAISIRYLHPKGKSHAAIFLFGTDGKLIRQITEPNDSQDVNPSFAPDGKSIIFTSENDSTQKRVLVSLDLASKGAKVIAGEPPAWYKSRVIAKGFSGDDDAAAPTPARDTYPTADGAYTIVLKPSKEKDADESDKEAFLRIGQKPALIPFRKMPGFVSFWMLHKTDAPFPPIAQPRIAVFDGSHNSTDGTQFYVLDLAGQRIVQLSPNGGEIFPWEGHPGFFANAQSRYEQLGDGRTVNCDYLDFYNEKLQRTRFGHALGRFSGASIFAPDGKSFNIVDPEYAP